MCQLLMWHTHIDPPQVYTHKYTHTHTYSCALILDIHTRRNNGNTVRTHRSGMFYV